MTTADGTAPEVSDEIVYVALAAWRDCFGMVTPDMMRAALLAAAGPMLAERDAEIERLRSLLRAIEDSRLDPARAIVKADRLAGEAIIRAHAAEAALAEAWDAAAYEAYSCGWMHDAGLADVRARNPHRALSAPTEGEKK